MFSTRIAIEPRAESADAKRVRRAGARGRPIIDLTESNPTRAGFDYPADLLAPLGDARGAALRAAAARR